MKVRLLFLLIPVLLLSFSERIFSQGMGISESSITPNASAILELRSTQRGFLTPRLTNAQRTTLASTAVQGLLVYDTQDNLFYYYNGGWQALFSGTSPLGVSSGGTGVATFGGTNTLLYTTSANTLSSIATANGGVLNTNATGVPSITATPTLGVAGSTLGTLSLSGNTSGTIAIRPQAAAGTYNFNLPTGAGSSGQILQSGGGAAAAMTWSTPTYPSTSGSAGQLLRSDGTNNVYTTLTFPNTIAIGEVPYGSAANVISNLAVGTAGQVFTSNASAAPSWKTLGGVASIVANRAATNATTVLVGTTYTLPANTATAGTVLRLRCNYRFVKTVGPPTLTCNLNVGGASVASFVITSTSSATTSGGYIEGYVTIRTTGAGGTLMSSLNGNNDHGSNVANQNAQLTNIATSAINTTAANVISLDMRMTTAVAGNTLTIAQGWVEVVKP